MLKNLFTIFALNRFLKFYLEGLTMIIFHLINRIKNLPENESEKENLLDTHSINGFAKKIIDQEFICK